MRDRIFLSMAVAGALLWLTTHFGVGSVRLQALVFLSIAVGVPVFLGCAGWLRKRDGKPPPAPPGGKLPPRSAPPSPAGSRPAGRSQATP